MDERGSDRERSLVSSRLVAGLVLAAGLLMLLVLFAADNFVLIEVRLVNIRIQMRLAWALLISVIGGGVAGFLIGRFWR